MGNACYGILWFLLLITFAFPIAFFCATFFIICYTFSPCCDGCKGISDLFLKGLQLPGTAVDGIIHCKGC